MKVSDVCPKISPYEKVGQNVENSVRCQKTYDMSSQLVEQPFQMHTEMGAGIFAFTDILWVILKLVYKNRMSALIYFFNAFINNFN